MPKYTNPTTQHVDEFIVALQDNSCPKGTFDSAASEDFMKGALSQNSVAVPETLKAVLDSAKDDEKEDVIRAILDGVNDYQREHGQAMPADLMEQALHNAYTTTPSARKMILDAVGTSTESAQAYQSNRAVLAIMATTTEAIPFVHYLPADIKSNQAKLAILTHTAGTLAGSYKDGSGLDGASSGERYISSARDHLLTHGVDGELTGKITAVQATPETCDPNGTVAKLMRGSALVYVNGMVCATEMSGSKATVSPIAGTVTIGSVDYAISGSINTDNGDISLKATPALPTTVKVLVEAFIDYERQDSLTPKIITTAETFDLFANPWRAITDQSIDSRTQTQNELGLDSYSEGILAIQAQFSNERHYDVLRKAKRIAINNSDTFNFNWAGAGDFKVRSDIWRDFSAVIGAASQRMAVATMNHGITHMYVGEKVAAQLQGLPSDIWQPSGISVRAGIFRLGRLFGMYDVYYTPRGVVEETESAEILCIGQATDVTRNAFILGDAVAPTIIPLATGSNFKTGAGYYARNFTAINPHHASAQGAALIKVTNLF